MIPIARELRFLILAIGVVAAFIHFNFGLIFAWPFWLVFLVLVILFRDFHRKVPSIPLAVVSPVDGVVHSVDSVNDPYLEREAFCITIKQSVLGEFNVHSPIEGKVENIWVQSLTTPSYSQLALLVQTDEKDDVVLTANLDSSFRHASCSISAGEKLGQGQRCGCMAFACKVEVYLPLTANVTIKAGQSVRAGSDKLAEFVHESDT